MTEQAITNETYAEEMNGVVLAVQMLAQSPVDELLALVQQAETLGPILEPTAYMRGGSKRLYEQRRMLTACAEVVRVWRQIEAENAS